MQLKDIRTKSHEPRAKSQDKRQDKRQTDKLIN
jgi:hypothetical protein